MSRASRRWVFFNPILRFLLTQIADKLCVGFAATTRWGNRKTKPITLKTAIHTLHNLTDMHFVLMYSMVMSKSKKRWFEDFQLVPHSGQLKACPGVYRLICKPTGQVYVGSGQDVSHRIRQHFNQLIKRKHPNLAMQSAWNLYGHSAFDWELLKELPPELNQLERFEWEERFMRSYSPDTLFNTVYPHSGEPIP